MKARWLAVVALAVSGGAWADDSIAELSAQTGLSEQQVQMVLGARTPHAEYRTSFKRTRDKFVQAVGKERYDALAAAYRGEKPRTERKS